MSGGFSFLGGVVIGAFLFNLAQRYEWTAPAFFTRLTGYGLAWALFCGLLL